MARRKANTRLRRALIDACLKMNELGINQVSSGNISVRVENGFLITPSGVAYDKMKPDQIVEMDMEGGYFGEWLPSSEWRFHYDILRTRPEAGAIVHTHSNYSTTLSCLRKEIPAFHYMIGVSSGDSIRCSDYATFGTQKLSDNILKALKDRTACLIGNHGMVCFGPTIDKALWLAVEVETLAFQYWHALQVGKPVILPKAEMSRVLGRFKTYGKQSDELEGTKQSALAVTPPPRRDG